MGRQEAFRSGVMYAGSKVERANTAFILHGMTGLAEMREHYEDLA